MAVTSAVYLGCLRATAKDKITRMYRKGHVAPTLLKTTKSAQAARLCSSPTNRALAGADFLPSRRLPPPPPSWLVSTPLRSKFGGRIVYGILRCEHVRDSVCEGRAVAEVTWARVWYSSGTTYSSFSTGEVHPPETPRPYQ
ncbi:unnamed protein product [Mycena citricolor]|uniref:Uncharacterized protein n=1 Tax=Mycena citricolor TaxID=2018698 RepID=A0AAD2Q0V3_9AGAR|nr:unnamed protein product [Mycena citricolor]